MSNVLSPYSVMLLASYEGLRQSEDVLPFMRNAIVGWGVPDEYLLEAPQHYQLFDSCSPISEQNEVLCDALAAELRRRGCPRPVVIGSRNWTPFFAETVSVLHRNRHDRVVASTTAAYSCYSVCHQYREGLAAVMEQIPGVVIDKAGPYSECDGLILVNVGALVASVQVSRPRTDDGVMKVLLVTHSTSVIMNAASANGTPTTRYDVQHIRAASRVAEVAEAYLGECLDWELVYCSRSGSLHISRLEPDINDRLAELTGVAGAVAALIGLTSNHMEVAYDLGIQARKSAAMADFDYERAATAGVHPDFIAILVDLLLEQAAVVRGELVSPDHPCLTEPASCRFPHPQKEQTHVPSAPYAH